ncbi:MAG: hypothetical protein ABSH08_13875 [Tepidisphaeraceae bacterium]|jgi:hypothetical protein
MNFFASVFALFARAGEASRSSRWYLIVLAGPTIAAADSPPVPFYYATATPMERQIASLPVGVNENVGQAVVSRNRKYVTLNVDPSLLGSASIRTFTYQKGGLGFVGRGAPPSSARPAAGNGLTPSIPASPGEIAPPLSILDKPGMVLIAPLER